MKKRVIMYVVSVLFLSFTYFAVVISGIINRFDMYNWLVLLYVILLVMFFFFFKSEKRYLGLYSIVLLFCNILLSLCGSTHYIRQLNEFRFELNTYWMESFLTYGLIAGISFIMVRLCSLIPHKIISFAFQAMIYLVAIYFMILGIQHFLLVEY